jgi:hypothetical protein
LLSPFSGLYHLGPVLRRAKPKLFGLGILRNCGLLTATGRALSVFGIVFGVFGHRCPTATIPFPTIFERDTSFKRAYAVTPKNNKKSPPKGALAGLLLARWYLAGRKRLGQRDYWIVVWSDPQLNLS